MGNYKYSTSVTSRFSKRGHRDDNVCTHLQQCWYRLGNAHNAIDSLALEIGIGLWRSHIFRNGIVHWVEESGDSRYDYLKTLADKFFVRRVIVSAIFPLVILMGLLFTSVDPFTFLILLAIISIALLVYSLYDFIKTYIFYGECEKAASHLIVIVQGES